MKRIALLFVLGMLAAGCEQTTQIAYLDASTCALACGAACCDPDEVCVEGSCCAPQCRGRSCGSDGCGGSCGSCEEGFLCNAQGQCVPDCAESDAEFCARLLIQCGAASGTDLCGEPRVVSECGPCPENLPYCDVRGQCRACIPESESELCARLGRNCGALSAPNNCGEQVVADCGGCTPPEECGANHAANLCGVPGQASNDDCDRAQLIHFDDAGTATFKADPSLATESGYGSCQPDSGKDVVYRFVLAQKKDVRIHAIPSDPSTRVNLYVRSSCANTASELGCIASEAPGEHRILMLAGLEPEISYFLWVDSATAEGAGLQTITVALTDPADPPQNDTCEGALVLHLAENPVTVAGTTAGANDHSTGSCAAMQGPDVLYSFTLEEPATALLTVRSQSAGFNPSVYVLNGCDSAGCAGAERACARGSSGVATVWAMELESGTYCAVIDSVTGWGDFILEFQTVALLNDSCDSTRPLVLDPRQNTVTVQGDTGLGEDDAASNCNPIATGKDLVWSLTVPEGLPQDLTVVVTPEEGSLLIPTLSLRKACDEQATELACAAASKPGPVTLDVFSLTPGTHFLWLDGYSASTNGAFKMTVVRTDAPPAPANDDCSGAEPLGLDAQTRTVTVNGDTFRAYDDIGSDCYGGPTAGKDLVWFFEVPFGPNQDVLVDVAPADGSLLVPVASVRTHCGQPASEIACNAASSTSPLGLGAFNLEPGTYYLWLDGAAASLDGAFEMTVTLSDAAPMLQNDGCEQAEPLYFDENGLVSVAGSTAGMTHATAPFGCGTGQSVPDVVYSFRLDEPRSVAVTLTPYRSFDAVLHVRKGNCETAQATDELACADQGAKGEPETAALLALEPGTYYVWIDGYSAADTGPFQLELAKRPPVNGLCSAAKPLVFADGSLVATDEGDTSLSSDSIVSTCNSWSTGKDLVWWYSIPAGSNRKVTITVVPGPGSALTPNPSVRAVCSEIATEVDCRETGIVGPVTLVLPDQPPGTYYVWVDGGSPTANGPFELIVTLSAPITNVSCATALELKVDPQTHSVTVSSDNRVGEDTTDSSCNDASTGKEVVFYFNVQGAPRDVTAVVTPAPGSALLPNPSLRSDCRSLASEIACAKTNQSDTPVTLTAYHLTAGAYYLLVDGWSASSNGPFSLELTLSPSREEPENDTCASAALVTLDSAGKGSMAGDTTHALNQDSGSCRTGDPDPSGPDVTYYFVTREMQDIEIKAVPLAGSGLAPVLILRESCAPGAAELGCMPASSAGTETVLSLARVPGGTYYVWVDSHSRPASGPFVLFVTARPPSPPPHDTCAGTPQSLVLGTSGSVQVTGTTFSALDTYSGSCASATVPQNGADVVYHFPLESERALRATVTRDASQSPTYRPALYLRRQCESSSPADELGCAASGEESGQASFSIGVLPPGDYYLVVDGVANTYGSFTLDVQTHAPVPNDTCASPLFLAPDALTGSVTVTGDTRGAADDTSATCKATTGHDVVYAFTVSEGEMKDVTVVVQPDVGSALDPVLSLRLECEQTDLACVSTKTLAAERLPPGTYYVWVDGSAPAKNGPFSLTLTWADSPVTPQNDTCANAKRITLPPSGPISESTTTALDDYQGACDQGSPGSPDVAYYFELTDDARVTATVTPRTGSSSYRAAVYLRRDCDTRDNDICRYATGAGPTRPAEVQASLARGVYYLIVDGVSGTKGDFDLVLTYDTTLYEDGDGCLNPIPLGPLFQPDEGGGVTATVHGDTLRTTHDGDGTCNSSSGGDYVYSFSVQTDSVVEIRAQPDTTSGESGYRSSFYLRSVCASSASELLCQYTSQQNTPKSDRYVHLQPGTYYVWIDTYSSSQSHNGPFSATIKVYDTPTLGHDTCRSPRWLGVTGATVPDTVTLSGEDGHFANDDYSGSCAPSIGPELVYSFGTSGERSFVATVTPVASSSYKPVLYLWTSCDVPGPDMEVTCARSTSGGSAVSIEANSLPPGDYFLVVDADLTSKSDTPGRFDLTVTLDAPKPGPVHDHCAAAQTIVLTGATTILRDQTTLNAVNDSHGYCGTSSAAPDVVYAFTLSEPAKVAAQVVPSGSYAPSVYLRGGGCGGLSNVRQIACANTSTAGATITATANSLHAGTYYLWVDAGTSTTTKWAGDFDLTITLSPPVEAPPANDTCEGAVPLSFGVSAEGNNTYANNDYHWGYSSRPGCQPPPASGNGLGKEVVFSYTPTTDQAFKVVMAPTNGCDAVMWVSTGACGDPRGCVGGADSGNPETVIVSDPVAGQTYWIYAEGYSASTNCVFTMTVTAP